MRFSTVDGCVVPADLEEELRAIKKDSGATLVSCYRGEDATEMLHRLGKWTQVDAWNAFINGTGNPANRPRQSTHECYSDGVAYRFPVGTRLRYWMVGMDWDIPHVQAVVKAAAKRGWTATVTYPTSTRERQHVNLRKEPKLAIFKSLRRGQKSPRVASIRKNLAYVRDPNTGKPYLRSPKRANGSSMFFDEDIYHALREFQRDHGQRDDGIYGLQTARQLAASVRFRKQRDKEKK